jgi:CubicO group peptidase (beta-lactamase class C family)
VKMRAFLSCLAITLALPLPGSAALSPSGLREAADYSAGHRGTSLLVVQGGRVIFEEYKGVSRSTPVKIYSGTKAFWCLAALAAKEDGILDLNEHASTVLPEWSRDTRKSGVTLLQLLSFSAGLNDAPSLHNDGWADRDAHAIKQPLVGSPGSSFIYGPAALQVFHEVLKRRLSARGETPTRYLERRVLRPLGLGKQRYLADKSGNPLLAAGFTMTASQWAKIGRALLANGEPILRGGLGPLRTGSPANPMFALGVWNNRLSSRPGAREVDPEELLALKWQQQSWNSTCLCHAAPADLLACVGSGGQRLYVSPSLNLIVVRQGGISKFSDGTFLRLLLDKS